MVSKLRFLDRDPDDLERYLLEQGRLDRAEEHVRARTIAHATIAATAGAGLTAASITAGSAAAAGTASWTVAAKWIAVGVASGALTVGVAEEWRHARPIERQRSAAEVALPSQPLAPNRGRQARTAEPESTAEPVTHPALAPGDSTPSEAPAAPAPVGLAAHETVGVAEETGKARKGLPRAEPEAARVNAPPAGRDERRPVEASAGEPLVPASPTAPSPRDTSLQGELRLLDDARLALEIHAGTRAMAALDAYARRFPAGDMRIEASALRIETLLALGQRDAARTLARTFLATHSSSPAAMRVRLLLESRDVPTSKP